MENALPKAAEPQRERKTYLDVLRIIAILFVIFNHTPGYLLYDWFGENTVSYWLCLGVSIFTNFNVPLFFMISGALLLGKNERIRDVFRNRVLWRFLSLAVFSLLSYGQQVLLRVYPPDIVEALRMMYRTSENGAYWFLYTYLGFLLCLPFLRRLAQGLTKTECRYLFILCLIFDAFYRLFTYFVFHDELWLNSQLSIDWIINRHFVLYVLLGFYLERFPPRSLGRRFDWRVAAVCAGALAGVAFTAVCVWLRCRVHWEDDNYTDWFHLFKPLYAVAVYVLVRRLDERVSARRGEKGPGRLARCAAYVGRHVFAVYLIHALVIRIPFFVSIYDQLILTLGPNLFSAGLYTLLVFAVSLAAAIPLRLIPGVRKIL